MSQIPQRFDLGNKHRPPAISTPPRDSDKGRVQAAVGILEQGRNARYWKEIQRLETPSGIEIRTGYYKNSGSGWNWTTTHLMLDVEAYNALHALAVSEGILVK